MKIRNKADGHNIRLWLPTSLLKSRVGYSIIKQALKNNFEKKAKKEASDAEAEYNEAVESKREAFEMPISYKQIREMYASLKRIIKTNGHFNLVEVEKADGSKILIKVW